MPRTQNQNRYTGPGRRGANRAMTATEIRDWRQATERWHSAPPWTVETLQDNRSVMDMLIHLYEDGVSLPDLAATAQWEQSRVAGILHRARAEGMGTGSRRYIPTAVEVERAEKPPTHRELTAAEKTALEGMYAALPQFASGARGWKNDQAQVLLAEIDRLNADTVSLDPIGAVLGMRRQAVHQHLSKYRAARELQDA